MAEDYKELVKKIGEVAEDQKELKDAVEKLRSTILAAKLAPPKGEMLEAEEVGGIETVERKGNVVLLDVPGKGYLIRTPRHRKVKVGGRTVKKIKPIGPYKSLKTAKKHFEREVERVG